MDILDALDQTFDHTGTLIAGVKPEQLEDKTPCAEWNVRDLLEHMIAVVDGLGDAAAGKPQGAFTLGADPSAQFGEVAAKARAAWHASGVLDAVVDGPGGPMPGRVLAGINLLDTATHSWDLAVATGQPSALPEGVAQIALEASHQIVSPEIRTGRFGPEVPAAPGAEATAQLVAFLGRQP